MVRGNQSNFRGTMQYRRFGRSGRFPMHFYSTPTLDEATGMSLETLYEKFFEPRPEICLVADRRLGDLAE